MSSNSIVDLRIIMSLDPDVVALRPINQIALAVHMAQKQPFTAVIFPDLVKKIIREFAVSHPHFYLPLRIQS